DREPELDEVNARVHEHLLELGSRASELEVLLRGAVPHDAFDACAVVPGAVEEHDLARGREVRDVALEVPLLLFALGRNLERDDACTTGVQVLGEALDRSTLASGIATLKDDHDLLARLLDPRLQLEQLDLQLALELLVLLALHLLRV